MKNEGQAFVLEVPKEVRNDKPTNDERSRKEQADRKKGKNYRAQKLRLLSVYFRKIFKNHAKICGIKITLKTKKGKKTLIEKNFLKKIEKNW